MDKRRGSHQRRLLDLLMQGQLENFVRDLRDVGVSWRRIAIELEKRTGVDVAGGTLHAWFRDEDEDEAKAG